MKETLIAHAVIELNSNWESLNKTLPLNSSGIHPLLPWIPGELPHLPGCIPALQDHQLLVDALNLLQAGADPFLDLEDVKFPDLILIRCPALHGAAHGGQFVLQLLLLLVSASNTAKSDHGIIPLQHRPALGSLPPFLRRSTTFHGSCAGFCWNFSLSCLLKAAVKLHLIQSNLNDFILLLNIEESLEIEAFLVKLSKTGNISHMEKAGLRKSMEWLIWVDSMSHKQNKMLFQGVF